MQVTFGSQAGGWRPVQDKGLKAILAPLTPENEVHMHPTMTQ
jgi:hypothetical protein